METLFVGVCLAVWLCVCVSNLNTFVLPGLKIKHLGPKWKKIADVSESMTSVSHERSASMHQQVGGASFHRALISHTHTHTDQSDKASVLS